MRTANQFLGQFASLTHYDPTGVDLPDIEQAELLEDTEGISPKFLLIDFDVRPVRTYITDSLLRNSYPIKIDWDDAVRKVARRVRDVVANQGFSGTYTHISGLCDDGTMACTVVIPEPHSEGLYRLKGKLSNLIVVQRWHKHSGVDAVPKTMRGGFTWYGPRNDRIQYTVRDAASNKALYMIAESFFATTDTGLTFALTQWNVLQGAMLRAEQP